MNTLDHMFKEAIEMLIWLFFAIAEVFWRNAVSTTLPVASKITYPVNFGFESYTALSSFL